MKLLLVIVAGIGVLLIVFIKTLYVLNEPLSQEWQKKTWRFILVSLFVAFILVLILVVRPLPVR